MILVIDVLVITSAKTMYYYFNIMYKIIRFYFGNNN